MIEVIRREYEPDTFTNDIYVNGRVYCRAVGDCILDEIIRRIRLCYGL